MFEDPKTDFIDPFAVGSVGDVSVVEEAECGKDVRDGGRWPRWSRRSGREVGGIVVLGTKLERKGHRHDEVLA